MPPEASLPLRISVADPSQQWLVNAARQAGLPGVERIALSAQTDSPEAWNLVATAARITQEELARRLATQFRLQPARLDEADPVAQRLVPETIALRYQVLPLRADERTLVVAASNPLDWDAEQALQFASSRRVVFELAPPSAIEQRVRAAYSPDSAVEGLLSHLDAEIADAVRFLADERPASVEEKETSAAPIVKLTNLILREGVARRASDIHIEPSDAQGEVRFRVDGVLRAFTSLPLPAMRRVISRIKILADMDISDRLRPQDGSTRIEVENRSYDLRVSTVPMRDTEKLVIRILGQQGVQRLDDLAIAPPELKRIRGLLGNRTGVVVATGPTGSGKTTLLYAALRELATGENNITSVEDPVEYQVAGISQIQVDTKQGVTFAAALRAVLRQDPDIIFVGEIRDRETAEIAVQASLTGHLVLATVHANEAAGVVGRLAKLGLPLSSIADTFRGAISQRLLRRVCSACAAPVGETLTAEEASLSEQYGVRPTVRAVGCGRCEGTGYYGRVPVVEVLVASRPLLSQVAAGAVGATLEETAVAGGMRTMRAVALERVAGGETTLQEVQRVLGTSDEPPPAQAAAPHVLWVDDDAENRLFGRVILEDEGFTVTEAEDGEQAIAMLQAGGPFQLVVLDLHMPGLDGRGVLRHMRRSLATARVPVIVLTGATSDELEHRLLEEGADDYLRKPVDADRMLARVRAVLRRAKL